MISEIKFGYIMSKDEYHDIDSIEDFEIVEKLFE